MVKIVPLSQKRKTGNLLSLVDVKAIHDDCILTKKGKQTEYGAVINVSPINFGLMSDAEQEVVLEGFRSLLQRLNIDATVSIHVRVLPYNISPYLEKLYDAGQDPLSLKMARDHEQFVRSLSSKQAILRREFYIRLLLPPIKTKKRVSQDEHFDLMQSKLDLICEDLLEDIQACGLSGYRLNDNELAQYFLSCIHTHYAEQYPLQEANMLALDKPIKGLTYTKLRQSLNDTTQVAHIKDNDEEGAIEPAIIEESSTAVKAPGKKNKQQKTKVTPHTTLVDLLQPAFVEQNVHYIKLHREQSEYFRARSIEGYPAIVIAGWLDRLIQIDEPYTDILLFIKTLNPEHYANNLTRQMTGYRATQQIDTRNGRTENPYISVALEEVEDLRDKIVRQIERVHAVSLYIGTRGTTISELKQRDEKILSLLRSLDLESAEVSMEHVQAWQSFLPDGHDILARRKILDTSSLVTAFPFASSTLSTEPGSLNGIMPNGSLVIVNPASPQLDNGNEVKFARSGAGKSFDEKVRLGRNLLLGYEAVVIDPEDEYLALCKEYNGVNVRLSSELQLNPFDLPQSDAKDRNILEEQYQSLLVLFDLLLADRDPGTLSQKEKAFLQKCISRAYANQGITSDTATHQKTPPSMYDLYEVVSSGECGKDVFDLGDRIARHLPAFPRETSLQLSNRLVVFNIRDLSDEMKPVGLFLITDHVWKLVRSEKHQKPRLLIIDEAWSLLEFPEGGRFLASLSRRARKYNLFLRVITQNVEDFLGSEAGRTILVNASMKFLMKQDATTIDAVQQAFKLSEGERQYLLSCKRGSGLFFCGLSHVPLEVVASELEYEIATTNPQEILNKELERLALEKEYAEMQKTEAIAIQQRMNEYSVVLPAFYQPHGTLEAEEG